MKRTVVFEYPWPLIFNKNEIEWMPFTMYDLSLDTKFHYSKNHGRESTQLLIKILGFGVRINWEPEYAFKEE